MHYAALCDPRWGWFWGKASFATALLQPGDRDYVHGVTPTVYGGEWTPDTVGRGFDNRSTDGRLVYEAGSAVQMADEPFSCFVLLRPGTLGNYEIMVANRTGVISDGDWSFGKTITHELYVNLREDSSNNFETASLEVQEGALHFAGFVRHADGNLTFWLDGVSEAEVSSVTTTVGASPYLVIGSSRQTGNGGEIPGNYFATYVFKGHALTEGEVHALTADPFGPIRPARRTFVPVTTGYTEVEEEAGPEDQSIAVGTAAADWQGVPLTASLGALTQAISPASGAWQGVSPTVVAGTTVALTPAAGSWQGVAMSALLGALSQALGRGVGSWQGVSLSALPGERAVAVGPGVAGWQSVSVSLQLPTLSLAASPAEASWAAVSLSSLLGTLSQALSPAAANWQGVSLSVVQGAQNVSLSPAQAAWEGVVVAPSAGAVLQALTPATATWQGVSIAALQGAQSLSASPAAATWQGVGLTSTVGEVQVVVNPAVAGWQGVGVEMGGSLSAALSPAAATWQGVDVAPTAGAVLSLGAAVAGWRGDRKSVV